MRQDRTGQDRTGQVRSGQDRTGQDRSGQDRSGQVRSYRHYSIRIKLFQIGWADSARDNSIQAESRRIEASKDGLGQIERN